MSIIDFPVTTSFVLHLRARPSPPHHSFVRKRMSQLNTLACFFVWNFYLVILRRLTLHQMTSFCFFSLLTDSTILASTLTNIIEIFLFVLYFNKKEKAHAAVT